MKTRALSVLLLFLAFAMQAVAQGTIRGKITDEKGEPFYGADVYLKEERSGGTRSDFDGLYTLKVANGGKQTLVIAAFEMDTIRQEVTVSDNKILVFNFELKAPLSDTLAIVTITAKGNNAGDPAIDKLRMKNPGSVDIIGRNLTTKTGDPSVLAAMGRVPGVSTSGGLITVRGIGDRYVKTTLNGLRIPTLDPLTNNIKLDIFPTSLIDNVIIAKTATPDLPGDWSGAYISVQTRDYSEQLMVQIETQAGFNVQTSFQDVITSQRSSTDMWGFDNGLRLRTTNTVAAPNLAPTTYREMVALGLESYYKEMGVNGWVDGSPESDQYFRLGLVQLGLLSASQINDNQAYQQAKAQYTAQYKPLAFSRINPENTNYGNGFSNSWNAIYRKAPLNFSQNFTIANQQMLFGRPLGYLFGFRYGNTIRYDQNGISQRIGAEELNYQTDLRDLAEVSRETNGWNALMNLAYTLDENNKVTFLFMPNYTGTNDVARFSTEPDHTQGQEGRTQITQFYEQRRQIVSQVKSSHFFQQSKMKIDFEAGYTLGKSTAPDFKVTQFGFIKDNDSIVDYIFAPSAGDGIRRYYRYLDDNIFDSRIAAELPLNRRNAETGKKETKYTRKLRFGGAYQYNDRRSDLNEYYLQDGNNNQKAQLESDDLDGYLNGDKFTMQNQQIDFYYSERYFERNHTVGFTRIGAGFAMLDYEFASGLRFAGGLRVENSHIFSDVVKYKEEGYGRDDMRRENLGGFPLVNAADIKETNFLPSANFVYKLKDREKVEQTNLRLNFSQTIARPSIRELNDAAVYDNEFRTLIYGNSDLKIVHIRNYDFRYETFFKNDDNVSASVFFKDFRNHIEMGFGSSGVTWENIDKSTVFGLELEGKKVVKKVLELRANVTLVRSNSVFVRKDLQIIDGRKVYTPVDTINRAMFGQAPYIINGIVSYKADSAGLTFTASYNLQGPRLAITGVVKGRPDVYEMPRHTVDLKIMKKMGKHFTLSVTARDLLNAPVRRAYRLPGEWKDFDNYRYGTSFILGVTYKL